MATHGERGFTLIEMIIFIVIVGVGVTGILSVMNQVAMHSADPLVRKQTSAMAESVLEEILLKSYCNPATVNSTTSPPTCGAASANTFWADFDNVDDYATKTQDYFGRSTPTDSPASASPNSRWPLSGYTMTISVGAEAAVSGQNMKKVTVTVTRGNESVAVVGYRANF